MADIRAGVIVQLPELKPGSQFFKPLQSVRVHGLLESYTVESGTGVITHSGSRFRVDLQFLRDVSFRKGSLYQFIGELVPDPIYVSPDQLMLQIPFRLVFKRRFIV
ncbi:hypothetical protein MPTK1_8g01820 [Marchantia polymorpha subsp. ruderalis]|uniref:Uncharacterized protein n=1 Tax=Marchantia polymorpha TaxID=3197 RepID=A0A2R6WR63_MARPO|nr:hypothetical protein MARPO_0064s0018 [Marchantia polymorpha]BBN18347.1 hypothetical protein Mp_8g01820 [Marchantia polymorpha subsp. ruderalis]|eukprot:PTQ36326.1 hypothetical protein MARPO_0064s0018 [Marchantia polymorpha]